MSQHVHDVPESFKKKALVGAHRYDEMYARSMKDPEAFWGEHGMRIDWIKPYTRVKNTSFAPGAVAIEWFGDGTTNVSMNCIDRHLADKGDKVAIIWEGDDPKDSRSITYRELHAEVCRFANVLKREGVRTGDRVTIYMPMIPEAAFAMLACARIGAIHSVVFGGFSPDALAGRITGCDSRVVITSDESLRGGRVVPLKKNVDARHREVGTRRARHRGEAHRRRRGDAGGPRRLLRRAGRRGRHGLRAGGDGRGSAALHPLHLGLDRPAEGRAAHHRRLPRLCRDDASIRLRRAWGRRLLVHGGRRLGDGPQLHRLRAARQRRHHADVRGRPQLSQRVSHVGRGRQAQGVDPLHRPHRHPRPDGLGRRAGEADEPRQPAPAGLRRRADQPRSLGVVPPRRRRRALPHRRHLVADRNRRHPHHAAARRDEAQGGIRHQALLRREAGGPGCRSEGAGRGLRGQPRHRRVLAGTEA